jgi:hypothetical protein
MAPTSNGRSAMPPKPFQYLPTALPGIDAMQADSHFAFGRHMHLQFGLGVIDRGAQKSFSGRGTVESLPGDTITVNPGEVHDGKPLGDGGRAWRILYLEPALVAGLAAEVRPSTPGAGFEFHAPNLRDARLAAQVRALFAAATRQRRCRSRNACSRSWRACCARRTRAGTSPRPMPTPAPWWTTTRPWPGAFPTWPARPG